MVTCNEVRKSISQINKGFLQVAPPLISRVHPGFLPRRLDDALTAAVRGLEMPELIASQTLGSNAAKASNSAPDVNFILQKLASER